MGGDYFTAGDRIPFDSCPEPELSWEQYRLGCAAQINQELPPALVKVILESTMPMSRWGRISELMLEAYKYGLDEGRNG